MYQKEMILACKSHKNGIFRKERATDGPPRAENVKLTLLETEEPQMFEMYDSFDVPEFIFSEESGNGSFKIQLSLQEQWKDLAIGAQIVDMEKESVIMDIPFVTEKDQSQLTVSKEFHLDSNQTATTIGIIAIGRWGGKRNPFDQNRRYCKGQRQRADGSRKCMERSGRRRDGGNHDGRR